MRINAAFVAEGDRLADLYSYNILNTAEEKDFNELVELVLGIYGCPSAAITFVDKDRMLFKTSIGVDRTEIPRDKSVCTHTIMQDEVLVVRDTHEDNRFSNNLLLTEELKIRFYAGAPIVSTAGFNLGAVCIFDQKPRQLTPQQRIGLKAIAKQISKLLELKAKNNLVQKQAISLLKAERQLAHSILQEQEKERLSIGVELHENIAQGLAATKLYLEVASQSVEHPFLKKSVETVTQLLQQTKTLTHSIVPTTLQSTSFKNLLQILVQRYSESQTFTINFSFRGPDLLSSELSVALYRMVEEAFENVRLHANADNIVLQVDIQKTVVRINIADNGIGISPSHFKKGTGLGSVALVIEHYGGTVDLVSNGAKGCLLSLQLPLHQTANVPMPNAEVFSS